jgi:hypothetical protein
MTQFKSEHTGLQPQSIQTLFNISDKGGKYYLSPEIEDEIWNQLGMFCPSFAVNEYLWLFLWDQYYTSEDQLIESAEDEYWNDNATFLLLILASEGKFII